MKLYKANVILISPSSLDIPTEILQFNSFKFNKVIKVYVRVNSFGRIIIDFMANLCTLPESDFYDVPHLLQAAYYNGVHFNLLSIGEIDEAQVVLMQEHRKCLINSYNEFISKNIENELTKS